MSIDRIASTPPLQTPDSHAHPQEQSLEQLRSFMKKRTCYDVLPVSFRLIVLDTTLLVKKSLSILLQNGRLSPVLVSRQGVNSITGIVSAPLWNSERSSFAGLLTSFDFINVIQYYYQYHSFPDAVAEIDTFRLDGLREVERKVGAIPPETISINPSTNLYDACKAIHTAKARRIPLVDRDSETGKEMLISVLTQYRILKWLAINCNFTSQLRLPLKDMALGTYGDIIATATMESPCIDVIHLMSKLGVSAIPIVDAHQVLLNIFEAVDVLNLIQDGAYHDLEMTVGEAILKRGDDFAGVPTCTVSDTLEGVFDAIRRTRVHRFVVVEKESGKLQGMLSLSDILGYIL